MKEAFLLGLGLVAGCAQAVPAPVPSYPAPFSEPVASHNTDASERAACQAFAVKATPLAAASNIEQAPALLPDQHFRVSMSSEGAFLRFTPPVTGEWSLDLDRGLLAILRDAHDQVLFSIEQADGSALCPTVASLRVYALTAGEPVTLDLDTEDPRPVGLVLTRTHPDL